MVSVLALSSDNTSSNPATVYSFSVKMLSKRTRVNKKQSEIGPFLNRHKMKEEDAVKGLFKTPLRNHLV